MSTSTPTSGRAWRSSRGFPGGDIQAYLEKNLVGFKIGKTDWEFISNSFVIFPKIGFHFDDFGHGPGNAVITQSGSDICPVAVRVDRTQAHAGAQFVNAQFMSTLEVGPQNQGPVKLANCGFWGTPPPGNTSAIRAQLAGPDGLPFHRLGPRGQGRSLHPRHRRAAGGQRLRVHGRRQTRRHPGERA